MHVLLQLSARHKELESESNTLIAWSGEELHVLFGLREIILTAFEIKFRNVHIITSDPLVLQL